jgi:hypothetical protein
VDKEPPYTLTLEPQSPPPEIGLEVGEMQSEMQSETQSPLEIIEIKLENPGCSTVGRTRPKPNHKPNPYPTHSPNPDPQP